MKTLLFILIAALLLSFAASVWAEKMIQVPESELKEYLDRLEKDDKTIKALQAENYKLKLDLMNLQAEATKWKQADDKQMGFYLGGAIGYPIPAFEAMALYKFRRWGLYASGGWYVKSPSVNLGVVVKTK